MDQPTHAGRETAAEPSAMRRQVYSLPSLIRDEIWEIEARTRKAISTPQIFSLRTLILAGSGDSYMAARAAADAFVEFSGILPSVQTSLQAGRYTAAKLGPQPPDTPMTICVSSSGEAARLIEAAHAFNHQGGLTIALTANPAGRLAQATALTIPLHLPPFDPAPGVRSYILSLLALQMIAIRFGEVRGRITMDQAMSLRRELAAGADMVERIIEEADTACRNLAQAWLDYPAFEFLAGGPNVGTAAFGAAKILEAVGRHASAVDVEEWNHLNYFIGSPRETATLILSDANSAAQSRTREVFEYLNALGRPWATQGSERPANSPFHIPVRHTLRETFSPVAHTAPLALYAAYFNEMTGERYGRGSAGPWHHSRAGNAVRNSAIIPFFDEAAEEARI
ncbi:MAG: SIS domain-containing protein [Caldilineaceae bacterium]|nr:SIS domain-containing protein [Caldilineaceae bacterium]